MIIRLDITLHLELKEEDSIVKNRVHIEKNRLIVLLCLTLFFVFAKHVHAENNDLVIEGNPPSTVANFTYDGLEHSLVVGGNLRVKDDNGIIEYSVNGINWGTSIGTIHDAGTYIVEYRGKDNDGNIFAGPIKIGTVVVSPAKNSFVQTPNIADSFTYDGQKHPLFSSQGTAKSGNVEYHYSFNGGEYKISTSIPEVKDAGTYKVYCETATLVPNYVGEKTATSTIIVNPKQLNDVVVTVGGPLTYNAQEQTINITNVTSSSAFLVNKDYEIVNDTNKGVNANDYVLKIKGKGNYSFNAEAHWKINKLNITGGVVELGPELFFTGNEQTQTIQTVKKDSVVLKETDYVVSNNKQKNASSYTLTVSGNNKNTTGSIDKNWTIKPLNINNDNVEVVLGPTLTYNEKEQTQIIAAVKVKSTGAVINPNCYTVANNKGTNAKNYTLVINGKEDVIGRIEKEWEILKKTVTGTWSDNAFTYDGKEHSVYLKNLPSCAKATYSGNKATKPGEYTAKATITISGNDNYIAGSVPQLDWSISKIKYDMSKVKFESKTFAYDGKEHAITITGELPKGVIVQYKDNSLTKVGEKKATAIFIGDDMHEPIPNMYAQIKVLNNLIKKPKKDTTIFIENGKVQTYNIAQNEYYTFTGNKAIKAGKYKVKISLIDKNEWLWEDETSDDLSYDFIIRKKQIKCDEIVATDDVNGFDPSATLSVLYTERKDNTDYNHLANIDSVLGPHQDLNFAYLVKIIVDDREARLDGEANLELNIPNKFKGLKFNVINVQNRSLFEQIDYSLSDDGTKVKLQSNKLNEFVFLDNGNGNKVHFAKAYIIIAYIAAICIAYFLLKIRKVNNLIIIMIVYIVSYLITGLYIKCKVCVILDILAILVLLSSIFLYRKYIKVKNENNEETNSTNDTYINNE